MSSDTTSETDPGAGSKLVNKNSFLSLEAVGSQADEKEKGRRRSYTDPDTLAQGADEIEQGLAGPVDYGAVDMSSWRTNSFNSFGGNSFKPMGMEPWAPDWTSQWPGMPIPPMAGPAGLYGPPGMYSAFPPFPPFGMVPPPMSNGEPETAAQLEEKAAYLEAQAQQLKEAARQAEQQAHQMKTRSSPMMVAAEGQPKVPIGYLDAEDAWKMPAPALIENPNWTPKQVKSQEKSNNDKAKAKKVKDSSASSSSKAPTISPDERTTVMLRNIPNNYTREMLLELLDGEGFAAQYDFIYLPMDFSRMAGLGYAFINLVSNAVAERVKNHFDGFNRWSLASQKTGEVSWGEPLQGLEAHIERYRNSPVMHEDVNEKYRPLLFQDGVIVPFPEPTKRIRPPRVKRSCMGSKGGANGGDAIDGGGIDD